MKVLAFITSTQKMRCIIVSGTSSAPVADANAARVIKLPSNVNDGDGLMTLIQTLSILIDQQSPDQIAILLPGKSKFNNSSPIRIKLEAALQIASTQKDKPLHRVPPIRISSYRKKLEKNNVSVEALVNNGEPFSPAEIADAVCVGLVVLPDA